jgi:signal transduction histidine kinase
MSKTSKRNWRKLPLPGPAAPLLSASVVRAAAMRQAEGSRLARSRRNNDALGRRATDQASSYQRLRDLSAALQTIREEERTRLARELHDDLGQVLATLRIEFNQLQQLDLAMTRAERQLQSMDELLMQAVKSLRRIATELRPSALEEGGLYFALRNFRNEWVRRHGIPCTLDAQEDELVLEDRYSTAVFRIVQESLTNIVRHANATKVWISARRRGDTLRLNIEDNGNGIAPADLAKPGSFGLLGMRERVWALNGNIGIGKLADNWGGHGTHIAIELPLPPSEPSTLNHVQTETGARPQAGCA